MSMAEDIENLYDDDFDETDDSICREYLTGGLFWRTKNNNKINVLNMETSHIINCLKMKALRNKENWDIVFNYELNRRKNERKV